MEQASQFVDFRLQKVVNGYTGIGHLITPQGGDWPIRVFGTDLEALRKETRTTIENYFKYLWPGYDPKFEIEFLFDE